MKITENFKRACRIAKEKGYDSIYVTKGGKWGKDFFDIVSIDEILTTKEVYLSNTSRGYYSTNDNYKTYLESRKYIGYQKVFRLSRSDES